MYGVEYSIVGTQVHVSMRKQSDLTSVLSAGYLPMYLEAASGGTSARAGLETYQCPLVLLR